MTGIKKTKISRKLNIGVNDKSLVEKMEDTQKKQRKYKEAGMTIRLEKQLR